MQNLILISSTHTILTEYVQVFKVRKLLFQENYWVRVWLKDIDVINEAFAIDLQGVPISSDKG